MTESKVLSPIHPDLSIAHATSGRLRLLAPRIRGMPKKAEEVVRGLSSVQGVHRAHADPITGSVTIHYHPTALQSAEFFAEIAGALGLVAVGLEPSSVEAMFELLGVSPEELRHAWGDNLWPVVILPIVFLVLGFAVRRTEFWG